MCDAKKHHDWPNRKNLLNGHGLQTLLHTSSVMPLAKRRVDLQAQSCRKLNGDKMGSGRDLWGLTQIGCRATGDNGMFVNRGSCGRKSYDRTELGRPRLWPKLRRFQDQWMHFRVTALWLELWLPEFCGPGYGDSKLTGCSCSE